MNCIAPKKPQKTLDFRMYILDAAAELRACFCTRFVQSWNRGGGVGSGGHTLRSGQMSGEKPIMKREDGKSALDPLAR